MGGAPRCWMHDKLCDSDVGSVDGIIHRRHSEVHTEIPIRNNQPCSSL